MLCTKWAHQSRIFQNFECSNEILSKPSCHFWNHKFRVYSNFASLFSVMKDNFCFFVAQALYTLNKNSPTKINFQTSELLGENSPNSSCYIWNPKSFFLKLALLFSIIMDNFTYLSNLPETLYDLNKRDTSKCKSLDFWLLTWSFTKFVLWDATFVKSI